MELIGAISLAILAIIAAATSRQLTDEFKAWSPWLIRRIIQRAVRRLPQDQRERFAEEWPAHVNDIPGEVGKLIVAFGFLSASRAISSGSAPNRFFEWSKRAYDIVASISGLALLAPWLVVIVAAIKLGSPGPVLVRQTRFRYNNEPIQVLKFRSMTIAGGGDTCTQTVKDYPQVTWIGRWILQTNMDALPRLINVLLGEMSLVGPRPYPMALSPYLKKLIPPQSPLHNIKPGITGWAQVNGCYGEPDTIGNLQSRLEHDLFYAENRSFLLDLKIILMTIWVRNS